MRKLSCLLLCLAVAVTASGAGSGALFYRACMNPNLLPALRVTEAGPLTINVIGKGGQGEGSGGWIDLSLLDMSGVTVYTAPRLYFPDGSLRTTPVTIPSLAAGIYFLKPIGSFYEHFRFETSAAGFVWPNAINFMGHSLAGITPAGTYYFYVPPQATTFEVRLFVPDAGDYGTATVYAPDGTNRLFLPVSGRSDQSRTLLVGASDSGFWRVDLTDDFSDISFHLTGIPPFFAESPAAWFEAPWKNGNVRLSAPFQVGPMPQSIAATASVTPATATGSVAFILNDQLVATVPVAGGIASTTVILPTNGLFTIRATHFGDASQISSVDFLTIWAYGEHRQAGTGDFDGDGKSDVLWRNISTGEVGIWLMNGATISSSSAVGSAPLGNTIAAVGDFDHDGKSDILWRDPDGGVGMWLMNGLTIAAGAYAGGAPVTTRIIGVGDFNGDGFDDILFQSGDPHGPFGAKFGMWIMRGSTIVASKLVVQLQGFEVQGVADFDGDGSSDVLFRNGGGTYYVCLVNGLVIKEWLPLGTLVLPWDPDEMNIVAGTGDFNGDGTAEILVRNSAGRFGVAAVGAPSQQYWYGSLALTVSGTGDYNGDGKADVLLVDLSSIFVTACVMNYEYGYWVVSAGVGGAPPGHAIE